MKKQHILDSLEGIPVSGPGCPVSGIKLDYRAVRLVAAQVLVLIALWHWYGGALIPALLMVDFALRGFGGREYSPLACLGRWFAERMVWWNKSHTDAAPKIFAARLGFAFSVSLLLVEEWGGRGSPLSLAITVLFAGAAFLEAALGFCVGCLIYRWAQRLRQ